VGATYLVFSAEEGMMVMDQHAAHERILFEKLKKKSVKDDGYSVSQRLLMPEVISLSPRDFSFIMDCLPLLEACGFEMEPFGNDSVALKSIPAILSRLEPRRLINDFLEEFTVIEGVSVTEKMEKIFAFLACKGAVRANQNLSATEAVALCRDLDAIPYNQSCPHGRPVWVSFPISELERIFKRR
jgi:DNA mismatch repair protein MutL